MTKSIPKARDVIPLFTQYTEPDSSSGLFLDVDGDGTVDSTAIINHGDYYEFKVQFGNSTPTSSPPKSHSYFLPPRNYGLNQSVKNLNISFSFHTGIKYIENLSKKYENAKKLKDNLGDPQYASVVKAIGVLSKSSTFRDEMNDFLENGGGFTFDKDQGYYYSPKDKTFNIPHSEIFSALETIPHELYHRHDQPVDAHKLTEAQFIEKKCQNELNANIFSAKILQELGIPINQKTFPALESVVGQNGETPNIKNQGRVTNSHYMNYVELAAFQYRVEQSKDNFPTFLEIKRNYKNVRKWVSWFRNTYLDYYIRNPQQWGKEEPSVLKKKLQKAYEEVPSFKAYVENNKEVWSGLIHYTSHTDSLDDPHGVIYLQQANYFHYTLGRISNEYIEAANEEIRKSNAIKYNLEKYY